MNYVGVLANYNCGSHFFNNKKMKLILFLKYSKKIFLLQTEDGLV